MLAMMRTILCTRPAAVAGDFVGAASLAVLLYCMLQATGTA